MERGIYILGNDAVSADLHLNCWRCFKKEKDILLDFGIMLKKNAAFKLFAIYLPFSFDSEQFQGLYENTIASLDTIFNDKLGTEREEGIHNYTSVKKNGKIIWGIYDITDNKELEVISISGGTLIKFTPENKNLQKINSNDCYLRFRISATNDSIGNIITSDKTKDHFLKSSVDVKEIVSIRINNMRDMSKTLKKHLFENEKPYYNMKFVNIETVRLFFIANSKFEITATPDRSNFSTRDLENELWQDYLSGMELSEHSYCYFWKIMKSSEHYSFLFNLKKSRCNFKTIAIYVLGLVIINLLCGIGLYFITGLMDCIFG